MRKKIAIAVASTVSVFYFNTKAQNITLDTSFGNGGIVSIPLNGEADDLQILESADNKLFVYGKDIPASVSLIPNKIHKINLDGSYDTTFGASGILTLPNYISDFSITLQGNNKFLVAFQQTSTGTTPEISILRYNSDGSLDSTFANNGEFKTSYDGVNEFRYNNITVLADGSIMVATGSKLIKLSNNGFIDNSYGSNGVINQMNSGNVYSSNLSLLNLFNDKITKTNLNGALESSFGNNGTFTYPNTSFYYSKQNSTGNIYSLDLDNPIFHVISSNGILSNTISLTNDNNTLEYYSNFGFVGDRMFFVGTTSTDKPFIVSYNSSGNVSLINSSYSYKETSIDKGNFTSLLAKNNSVYAGGDKFIASTNKWYYIVAKYNVTNSTLTTSDLRTEKSTFNIFPNPINKGNTLYFNRAQSYELYDMSGKLLGKEKSALTIDTSKLNTGVYVIKTSEGEVKRVIVK